MTIITAKFSKNIAETANNMNMNLNLNEGGNVFKDAAGHLNAEENDELDFTL